MAKGPYAICVKHGSELFKGIGAHARMVRAPAPKTKKQRYLSGCPICAKENRSQ